MLSTRRRLYLYGITILLLYYIIVLRGITNFYFVWKILKNVLRHIFFCRKNHNWTSVIEDLFFFFFFNCIALFRSLLSVVYSRVEKRNYIILVRRSLVDNTRKKIVLSKSLQTKKKKKNTTRTMSRIVYVSFFNSSQYRLGLYHGIQYVQLK